MDTGVWSLWPELTTPGSGILWAGRWSWSQATTEDGEGSFRQRASHFPCLFPGHRCWLPAQFPCPSQSMGLQPAGSIVMHQARPEMTPPHPPGASQSRWALLWLSRAGSSSQLLSSLRGLGCCTVWDVGGQGSTAGSALTLSSSVSARVPPASPSSHSITAASSAERARLARGSSVRSTFHGGQVRDRRGTVQNGPPTSPTLSHEAAPAPHSRSRATSNLFSKLTSKLTRRCVPGTWWGQQLVGGLCGPASPSCGAVGGAGGCRGRS